MTTDQPTPAAHPPSSAAAAGAFGIVFDTAHLLHLPLAGLRAAGRVEGALPAADAALRDGQLVLTWVAGSEARPIRRDTLPLQLPVPGDPPAPFVVQFLDETLPPGAGRVEATLLDAAGEVRAVAEARCAVLGLADLPLRDGAIELPLRGTRLVDLPLRPLGQELKELARGHRADFRVGMREPTEVALPRLAEGDVHAMHLAKGAAKRFIGRAYPLNGLWVGVLHGATVMGQTGTVVSRDGIVGESWGMDQARVHPAYQMRAFQEAWPAEPLRCGDAGIWWCGPWRKLNYYHTHGEFFAALAQLEMFRDLAGVPEFDILLPDLGGWARDAVELFGLDARRIRFLGRDCIQPERLYWASGVLKHNVGIEPLIRAFSRRVRSAALARAAAGTLCLPDAPGRPQMIYIARTDAPIRPMLNEAELIEALRARGVRIFVAAELSYPQQVLACAGARVVIGPHGAGLTNIGFADRDALVVEIHPHFYTTPLYFRLAQVGGQRYRAFTAPEATTPEETARRAWRIDVPAFMDFLDPLLEAEAKAGRI